MAVFSCRRSRVACFWLLNTLVSPHDACLGFIDAPHPFQLHRVCALRHAAARLEVAMEAILALLPFRSGRFSRARALHASGTCLACTVALVCPHPWPYGFSGGTMFSDRSRVCDAMYHDQGLLVGRRSSPLVAELGCMPPSLSRPDTFGCFTDRRDERADANGTLRDASRLVQCNALCFVVGPLVSYADVQVTTTRFGGLFPVGYIQCVVNADTDAATVLP